MTKKIVFYSILLYVVLVACRISIDNPVSDSTSIEGIWVPSEKTLDYMDQSGYEFDLHSIEFLQDGTAVITNIPTIWIFPVESFSKDLFSGIGNWELLEGKKFESGASSILQLTLIDEKKTTLEFGSVLDIIGFVPTDKPKEIKWVTFLKCYPTLHINDENLMNMKNSLLNSPREQLGFSPIKPEDRIEIQGVINQTDLWVSVYNDFLSHNIFLRLDNKSYIWVYEQEHIWGIEEWVDHDGARWQEHITLQYQTDEINGGPINSLMVDYIGHDSRFINQPNNWYLSDNINDLLPIIEEWRSWRSSKPPSPQSLCP